MSNSTTPQEKDIKREHARATRERTVKVTAARKIIKEALGQYPPNLEALRDSTYLHDHMPIQQGDAYLAAVEYAIRARDFYLETQGRVRP